MNAIVAVALRTRNSKWFAHFKAECAHAWAVHLRTCELVAESRYPML